MCDVVRRYPERFSFSALVCGSDEKCLSALAEEFRPAFAALADREISISLPQGVRQLRGEEILRHCFEDCDVAFIAASGFSGLSYTLRAAALKKKIALANKESLVCGGELVMREAERAGLDLVPVDSEHSALFQALSFRRDAPYAKLILTASGGPFFRLPKEKLNEVTAQDALRHPTWRMGGKITIDSATLLNKGYEVIEAKWLYGAEFSQIETVVHPQSIVHSLVAFEDGSVMAQLAYPDMRLPIQLALTYPERIPCLPQLDLSALGSLQFYPLERENFPCFDLAVSAGKQGGTAPTVLNAAAEVAVTAFLQNRITFLQIADTVSCALDLIPFERVKDFGQLCETDRRARICAEHYIYGK